MFIWKLINSPFKFPKIKFYLGKVKYGTPFMLPRKAVNFTMEESKLKAEEWIADKNSRHFGKDLKTVAEKHNKGYLKFVDKKVSFDIVRLGWKYKFNSIRFEWNPMFSFVFFGLQFCIFIVPKNDSSYWESWIYYNEHTDKNKPTLKRLKQCIEEAPQRWTRHHNGEKSNRDYYQLNLKKKWVKLLY